MYPRLSRMERGCRGEIAINEQDSKVAEHEIELGEDGLAFIEKIPLGRYQVSVYAYDEGENELYRTAKPENVEIRAGKLATLHVTLIPSNTGSLLRAMSTSCG